MRMLCNVLVLVCAMPFVSCGGKSAPREDLTGKYFVDGSCVTTLGAPRSQSDHGMLLGMARRMHQDASDVVSRGSANGVVRVETDLGCSFDAVQRDGMVMAHDAACAPLAKSSRLASEAIEAQRKVRFQLHPGLARFQELNFNDLSAYDYVKTDEKTRNAFVCEGRILDGKPNRTDESILTYEGGISFPNEQDASLGCMPDSGPDNGATSGRLILRFGKSRRELVVYEEGVGCTVTATSEDGVVFRADGTECKLGDVGISELGVTRRNFDSYVLDFSAMSWTYVSTLWRNNGTATTQIQCMKAHAQLTGTLPESG